MLTIFISSVQLLLLAQAAENLDRLARQVILHHLFVHDNLGEISVFHPLRRDGILFAKAEAPKKNSTKID